MPNVKPTEEEIAACAAHFAEIAPKIVQTTAFGGDNREKIDYQVEVLRNPTRWKDEWDFAEAKGIDTEEDYELLGNLKDVFDWLNGEYDTADLGDFTKSWDSLVRG